MLHPFLWSQEFYGRRYIEGGVTHSDGLPKLETTSYVMLEEYACTWHFLLRELAVIQGLR